MSTVKETRDSLQKLVNKLKEYPNDAEVQSLILVDNVYSEFDIAYSDGRFYKEKNGIKTILCKVNSLKPLIIDTPILNDDSLLNIIKKILHKISIEFESERKEPFNMLIKLSDKEPHKFNIYYDNVHFHGYLIVYRDTITHQYSIEHFVVLAGRTRFPIDYFKLEDEIEEALRYICF